MAGPGLGHPGPGHYPRPSFGKLLWRFVTVAGTNNISGSSQVISNTACTYRGFTLKETTGSAVAAVTLYDNASAASGTILDVITFAAGESAREFYDPGIQAVHGVYLSVVAGAVAGGVRSS